jgi:hypothetical protein
VDIPAIGVHATSLEADGLEPDGSIHVPSVKTPQVLGYYTRSNPPCVPGPNQVPFALLGHIDGSGQKGVLYSLKELKAGDLVKVGLDNGQSCTYRITKLAQVDKKAFPTQDIWGPTPDAQIRIISCGGKFVGGQLGYALNLIGIGTLVN